MPKVFLWRVANKGIPTLSRLAELHCGTDETLCLHGCSVVETNVHVFFKCHVARAM